MDAIGGTVDVFMDASLHESDQIFLSDHRATKQSAAHVALLALSKAGDGVVKDLAASRLASSLAILGVQSALLLIQRGDAKEAANFESHELEPRSLSLQDMPVAIRNLLS